MSSKYKQVKRELAERMGTPLLEDKYGALDDLGRRIYCSASGCPCKASVLMTATPLCSWHDVAAPHSWPQVTEELVRIKAAGGRPQLPEIRSARWVIEALAKVKAHLAAHPVESQFARSAAKLKAIAESKSPPSQT